MSKFLSGTTPEFEVQWIEFKTKVWTGKDGYAESVALSDSVPEQTGRPHCLAYWREDEYWGFLFEGGVSALVNEQNVGYICARTDIGTEAEAEQKEESSHTASVAPKRRGRPPKAKAE